jgi:hypothetical protein
VNGIGVESRVEEGITDPVLFILYVWLTENTVLNADLTWCSWSHAPKTANHRGVLFRDSSEPCFSLSSSPSVFDFRPYGPCTPPSCLDDRIPTPDSAGGHSVGGHTCAGPRTVSCAALERALNSPDLSTFFFGGANPTNARGPWEPPSWFLQPLVVCWQIRFTAYQAPTTFLAERIFQPDFFLFLCDTFY